MTIQSLIAFQKLALVTGLSVPELPRDSVKNTNS